MDKYVIKFVNKNNGDVSYYRKTIMREKLVNGIMYRFNEYELTDSIEKANVIYSEDGALHIIAHIFVDQPVWANGFYITSHRLPTRREQISLDMTPLKKIVAYANGYKKASAKGRAALRKKMFDEEFIMACKESLEKINKLK